MTPEVTPEVFATFIVGSEEWKEPNEGVFGGYGIDVKEDVLIRMIASAIRWGAVEEREACAKRIDEMAENEAQNYTLEEVAAEIRARQ